MSSSSSFQALQGGCQGWCWQEVNLGLPGPVLSAWLSEELVRAAAFQGGVPGEGLLPPQSDNTQGHRPRSQGRARTGSAGGWDTDHQRRPGPGVLGCPSSSRNWREPRVRSVSLSETQDEVGAGVEVWVPAYSGHTVAPRSRVSLCTSGQHTSTQRPSSGAQSLGALAPAATPPGRGRSLLWPSCPAQLPSSVLSSRGLCVVPFRVLGLSTGLAWGWGQEGR